MSTLEELREYLKAKNNKNENKTKFVSDKSVFPFWNTPEGGTSVIRFLPDLDPNNSCFWVERQMIKLPFRGVKGEHDRDVAVTVPCMDMYGETCPIIAETRPWWKDPSLEDMARRYWKKKSYLFQGLVVSSEFKEEEVPENPIRRFVINTSIFNIIKSSLMDPEMEELPTGYDAGVDFRLIKTTKGGFADYSTSNWSRRPRALSDSERDIINEFGLNNLSDFLPKKPNAEELEVIKEMFAASVNDEAYDPVRWGNYFRPAGVAGTFTPKTQVQVPASKPTFAKKAAAENVPFDMDEAEAPRPTPTPTKASYSTDELLDRINRRRQV